MSKFDKIFEARKAVETETGKGAGPKKQIAAKKKAPPAAKGTAAQNQSKAKRPNPKIAADSAPKRRGRPPAKRSDPAYMGFTTYIHRETHHNVKMRLLANKEGQELSELVEDLLCTWLQRK